MSDYEHCVQHSEDTISNNLAGQFDVTAVLAALQGLAEKTSHPMVRSCLEQAYDDIVHLTSHGDEPGDDDEFDVEDDS